MRLSCWTVARVLCGKLSRLSVRYWKSGAFFIAIFISIILLIFYLCFLRVNIINRNARMHHFIFTLILILPTISIISPKCLKNGRLIRIIQLIFLRLRQECMIFLVTRFRFFHRIMLPKVRCIGSSDLMVNLCFIREMLD
ncbi:MAG: hypothetical protein BWX60_01094 [Candidatus Marinimicrobia bacterium ADurb.Bin030]|nr:MAG: hypothetical protein BWX60_01094 [Candidatus Marinimicrobia bacterium ADurb.Bin030]